MTLRKRLGFPVYRLPALAFDHGNILEYTMQRLRGKLEYTMIGFQLWPPEFSLSELQEVYEAILDRPLDKRNFRKKVLTTGILEPTSHTRKVGAAPSCRALSFPPRCRGLSRNALICLRCLERLFGNVRGWDHSECSLVVVYVVDNRFKGQTTNSALPMISRCAMGPKYRES